MSKHVSISVEEAADQHSLAFTEIDNGVVEASKPGMPLAISEEEEQPLHLHAAAVEEQSLKSAEILNYGWLRKSR